MTALRVLRKADAFQHPAALQRVAAQQKPEQHHCQGIAVSQLVGSFLAPYYLRRHVAGLACDSEVLAVGRDVVAVAYQYVAVGRANEESAVVEVLVASAGVMQFPERRGYLYRGVHYGIQPGEFHPGVQNVGKRRVLRRDKLHQEAEALGGVGGHHQRHYERRGRTAVLAQALEVLAEHCGIFQFLREVHFQRVVPPAVGGAVDCALSALPEKLRYFRLSA